ncbi:MAG: Metalloprotease PmbA [Turneriella sp.]|nr:Metalloprotease PmbA [Turneriella sp.]
MNTIDAMEKIASLAHAVNCSGFDIVAYDSFSESVEVFEKKVSSSEVQNSSGIGIRVFKDKKPGIAFTEKFSTDALKTCLNDALSHTQITAPVPFTVAPLVANTGEENFNRVSPHFNDFSFEKLLDFAKNLEEEVRSKDLRIENVPYTGAHRSRSTSYFLNSNGVSYSHTDEDFGAYSAAVASKDGEKKMGVYGNSRLEFIELQKISLAEEVWQRTLKQLGAKPVHSGKYRILFSNRISGSFFSMYSSAFFAQKAIHLESRLKGRVGEKIASGILNIKSIGRDKTLRGSRAYDAEGVPTQNVKVVENGIFKNFLYNLESAAIDKVTSTGNASRSVSSKAATSFKNFVVDKGTHSLKEILAQGKILLIDKFDGAAGCSSVSGEFSIGAHGSLFENGEIVHSVDRITLSGNFFEMLERIEEISNEYNDQYSSVRVPDILIDSVSVAG